MQATLEYALSRVTQENIHVVGSGRTDAGAHAVTQIIAFSTESRLGANTLQRAANAMLPRDVAVTWARDVDESFHPRFDARARHYRYVIWNRPVRSPFWEGRAAHVRPRLDVDLMNEAAQQLVGRHDFGSFVPSNFDASRERTVWSAEFWRDGDIVRFDVRAEGFMRQMVRSMVGTLIDVGRGKITTEKFAEIVRACNRTEAGLTAPAGGLYLMAVQYGEVEDHSERTTTGPKQQSDVAVTAPEEKR